MKHLPVLIRDFVTDECFNLNILLVNTTALALDLFAFLGGQCRQEMIKIFVIVGEPMILAAKPC